MASQDGEAGYPCEECGAKPAFCLWESRPLCATCIKKLLGVEDKPQQEEQTNVLSPPET